MDISLELAKELQIKKEQVDVTIKLIDEGNTIPFIARYRKEMHGTMDEKFLSEIFSLLQKYFTLAYFSEMLSHKCLVVSEEQLSEIIISTFSKLNSGCLIIDLSVFSKYSALL